MDGGNNPDADGDFSNAPIFNFNFNDGKVKFNAHWYVHANENYGSASAFLSKSLSTRKGIRKTDTLSTTQS